MKRILSFLLLFLLILNCQAQRVNEQLGNYSNSKELMTHSHDTTVKTGPLRFMLSGLMYVYQNVISDHYYSKCIYYPSCSNFGKFSIKEYGWIKGIAITTDRIQRCNTLSASKEPHLFKIAEFSYFDPPSRYKKDD